MLSDTWLLICIRPTGHVCEGVIIWHEASTNIRKWILQLWQYVLTFKICPKQGKACFNIFDIVSDIKIIWKYLIAIRITNVIRITLALDYKRHSHTSLYVQGFTRPIYHCLLHNIDSNKYNLDRARTGTWLDCRSTNCSSKIRHERKRLYSF